LQFAGVSEGVQLQGWGCDGAASRASVRDLVIGPLHDERELREFICAVIVAVD
jgi:hypothetical protein